MEKMIFFLSLVLVAGCSSGPCNNVPQRPDTPGSLTAPSKTDDKASDKATDKAPDKRSVQSEETVQVSMDTGEKQCGFAKATPMDKIQKKLTAKKIKVSDAKTGSDGMIHTEVCGATTGNVYIFTISKKDLKKALKLGFVEYVR